MNACACERVCQLWFDTQTNELLYAHDSGLAVRTRPQWDDGEWHSITTNLQIAEVVSTAYDAKSNLVLAAVQVNIFHL